MQLDTAWGLLTGAPVSPLRGVYNHLLGSLVAHVYLQRVKVNSYKGLLISADEEPPEGRWPPALSRSALVRSRRSCRPDRTAPP
jgi:hypothetical protein